MVTEWFFNLFLDLFLISNKLEQLERKLEKNIGIKKHAGKVRKGFFSMATVIWQVFDCELCMKKVARSLGLTFNLVWFAKLFNDGGLTIIAICMRMAKTCQFSPPFLLIENDRKFMYQRLPINYGLKKTFSRNKLWFEYSEWDTSSV